MEMENEEADAMCTLGDIFAGSSSNNQDQTVDNSGEADDNSPEADSEHQTNVYFVPLPESPQHAPGIRSSAAVYYNQPVDELYIQVLPHRKEALNEGEMGTKSDGIFCNDMPDYIQRTSMTQDEVNSDQKQTSTQQTNPVETPAGQLPPPLITECTNPQEMPEYIQLTSMTCDEVTNGLAQPSISEPEESIKPIDIPDYIQLIAFKEENEYLHLIDTKESARKHRHVPANRCADKVIVDKSEGGVKGKITSASVKAPTKTKETVEGRPGMTSRKEFFCLPITVIIAVTSAILIYWTFFHPKHQTLDRHNIPTEEFIENTSLTTSIMQFTTKVTKKGLEYRADSAHLTSVPKAINSKTSIIILSNNFIEKTSRSDGRGLSKVTELDMSFNRLRKLPSILHNFKAKLVVLHLKGNKISDLDESLLKKLKKLQMLDLSSNHLSSYPDKVNVPLNWLNLEGNSLSVFPGLSMRIKYINLNRNKLSTIKMKNFLFYNISEIHLAENRLKYVPPPYQHIFMPVLVNLTGNPLDCDVNVGWMTRTSGTCLGHCHKPEKYRGMCVSGFSAALLDRPKPRTAVFSKRVCTRCYSRMMPMVNVSRAEVGTKRKKCHNACVQRGDCLYFNYNKQDARCSLSTTEGIDENTDYDPGESWGRKIMKWDVYYIIPAHANCTCV